MKTSLGILKRDLMVLTKNPIALLVVGALLVLPGLYAWYCIIANWDPYANTGSMPVAVVNQDTGASNNLTGEINIGKQVEDKLHDNDSIDWRFYDSKEEALNDTRTGVVYATLVLPENLSKNLLGIFEGSSDPPVVDYYPNEKYNAVATKVTDSAAQTLIIQINQGFSSTVNQKVLESTKKIAEGAQDKIEKTGKSALEEIKDVQADLDKVVASLDDAQSMIAGWRTAASGSSGALAATAEQLPGIESLLNQAGDELNDLRSKTSTFESNLADTVLKSAGTISDLSMQSTTRLTKATKDLQVVLTKLKALEEAASGNLSLEWVAVKLGLVTTVLEDVVSGVSDRASQLNTTVQETASGATTATTRITDEVMPRLSDGAYNLAVSLSRLSGATGEFEPQIDQLIDVLGQADQALADASAAIADAQALLSVISINLRSTATDLGTTGKALQIDRLADLLNVDDDNLGTFVSSPVQIKTEKIYPVSNYGTAVAPFYTNLALWVGCFILVSLIKVEPGLKGFEGAIPRERYFGRWWLFVIFSLLQSQVICGVDILLGIDCAQPALFMLAGAVCSFAYMNLIFALVKTFRNIGKTLCIILLIMQVPGSSGMYPIEIMPGFFQAIHLALPFTYGIDAMREALCGLSGWAYPLDLLALLLIVPGSLVLGLVLRPLMANLLTLFDDEMRKTGFFASEEHTATETDRFRGMMRALASHSAFSDDIEERAWRFNRAYPRRRRWGSILARVIPFAFVVLMLPLNAVANLDTDAKLIALVLMILIMLIVSFLLIVLEYMHRSIDEETRLLGASILGEDFDLSDLQPEEDEEPTPDAADGKVAAFVPTVQAQATAAQLNRAVGSPARDIYMTDLRLGFQSVIGVIVIMLLVITPSLYAWFNIAASWDPYGATGNLKVAVANEDEGFRGELLPVTIRVGDTVVSQLRGNSGFDWKFVDPDQAINGVESSEYYAAIVIPKDFSRNLMTYLTDDADYPNVIYYTNEKENPIAPIITQKGANSIQESIRVSFTEKVDTVVLSVAYDVLSYLKNPNMTSYVAKMSGHLDDATHDANSGARELRALSGLTNTTAGIVSATGTALDGLKGVGASAKGAIADAKSGISSASSAIDTAVEIVRSSLDDRNLDIGKVKEIIDAALGLLELGADGLDARIQSTIDEVQAAKETATTEEQKAACQEVIESLKAAQQDAASAPASIANSRAEIDGLIDGTQAEVNEAKDYFNNMVAPSINGLRSTLGGIAESTDQVVGGLEGTLGGLGDSTEGLSGQLRALSGALSKSGDKLASAANNIDDTKARVAEALKSGDLKQIESVILGGDPEAIAASLAAPLKQNRQPLYSVSNFGSSMASFYTVLSLWVGALVIVSTMRLHIVEERLEELRRRFAKVRARHEFFGRYGIFGLVGFMQAALVLLGDMMFLHIQCVNPVMFFICGLFVGQVFCLIVYTISELFGDIGKALCVILLIMQVAASGGTFPPEMLTSILHNVVPFLPFSHAMGLLQECVAGIYWPAVFVDVASLFVMAGAILVIGLPLRRPFSKLNKFFEEQLEKTGYM